MKKHKIIFQVLLGLMISSTSVFLFFKTDLLIGYFTTILLFIVGILYIIDTFKK